MNGWSSESLRQELQPDIRVIVVELGAWRPSCRRTSRTSRPKEGIEQFYEQLAITADDIAQLIAFAVTRAREHPDPRAPMPAGISPGRHLCWHCASTQAAYLPQSLAHCDW